MGSLDLFDIEDILEDITKGSVSYLSSPCFSTSIGGIGGQPVENVDF